MNILPYVYKLIHKETGEFYIGYRSGNKVPAEQDLPIYQSSSKTVKDMGFTNFNWDIVLEFPDRDAAYQYEQLLISESIDSPLCLNKHYVRDGNRHFKRHGPHSEETKAKIKEKNLANTPRGHTQTEEMKRKMSEGQKAAMTDERRAKMSASAKGNRSGAGRKGYKMSEETKRKISETKRRNRENATMAEGTV